MAEETQPSFVSQTAILLIGKRSVTLTEKLYTIGRKETNIICIKDPQISGQHAELTYKKDGWWIQDLKSRNGIFVNGKKVESCLLRHGDTVRFGEISGVFHYSENLKRKHLLKKLGVLAGILLLIYLSGKLYYNYRSPTRHIYHLPKIHGNLLEDFSFEDGFFWECGSKMGIYSNQAHSGRSSLQFSNNQNSTISETSYTRTIRVPYKKCYNISAWIKSVDLDGYAGIKVSWIAGQKHIGDSLSNMIQGTKDWEKIEFVAIPPPNTDEFQLSCIVIGKGTSVYFDDIVAIEQKEIPSQLQNFEFAGMQIHIDSRGIIRVYASTGESCDLGIWEVYSGVNKQSLLGTQKIAYYNRLAEAQTWNGYWGELESGKPIFAKVLAQFSNQELLLDYQVKLPIEQSQTITKYRLWLSKNFLSRQYIDSESTKFMNSEVSWYFPKAKKKFRLLFATPLEWAFQSESSGAGYTTQVYLTPQDSQLSWKLRLQITNLEDARQLQQWYNDAQAKQNKNQLGQAILLYQKVTDSVLPIEIEELAKQQIQQLEKVWEYDISQLHQIWDQARFFNIYSSYQQSLEKAIPLILRWEGHPQFSTLQEILNQLKAESERLYEIENNRNVNRLLHIAQNLSIDGNIFLALAVYQNILEKYPQCNEANIAKQQIEILNKKKKQ